MERYFLLNYTNGNFKSQFPIREKNFKNNTPPKFLKYIPKTPLFKVENCQSLDYRNPSKRCFSIILRTFSIFLSIYSFIVSSFRAFSISLVFRALCYLYALYASLFVLSSLPCFLVSASKQLF